MTHLRTVVSAFVVIAVGASIAHAQPAPTEKGDAKALLASGLKLYAAKDYLGALAVFRDAYARFPSGKILLNIGTTLLKLERKAEAANAYQGYLDAPDVDADKKPEVEKVLAGLDRELAVLELDIRPIDAEVKVGDGDWTRASELPRLRVAKGAMTVRARREGYVSASEDYEVAAGERSTVTIALVSEPRVSTGPGDGARRIDNGIEKRATPVGSRPPLGAAAVAHIDPVNAGWAARVAVTYEPMSQLQLQAGAMLGPTYGAYAGASYAFLTGRARPLVALGLPVFVSDGPRFAVRGAAGIEVVLHDRLSLIAEVGGERNLNREDGVELWVFIPAIGALGRL